MDSPSEDEKTMEQKYQDSYRGVRIERKFVVGDELTLVHPLDSVPEIRDKSWTNGRLAWVRGATSDDADVVGWWVLPRKRQKKTTRKYRSKKVLSPLEKAKLNFNKPTEKISRQRRMENRAKKSIRILRSQGYSMAEALMITRGQMGLDGNLIEATPEDGEE